MAQNGSRVALRRHTPRRASSAPPAPTKRSHKNSANQSTEFWISLTDKHKLRRSQINAAARAASAAAFLKSLRRQLHALLGCGPATCFATRRYTVQPARIRKLRRTGQVSKALRRPDRAKVMNHDQSRPRTARAHRPIARTGRSWLVGVTPRDMARARRPARPNGPTKNSANQVHGVLDQPNG
jgi:hypothetical protein